MKYLFSSLFCLLFFFKSFSTNIRGQVVRYFPSSGQYYPLAGVRVDLWIFNGQQWIDVSYYVTGQDGLYYFVGLGPGSIIKLQVFGNFFPPQPITIQNVYPPYYQDIPWIIT